MTDAPLKVRSSLPVLVAALLAVVALTAWQAAERSESERTRRLLEAQADAIVARAATRLEQLSAGLDRAALRWTGIANLSETLATVESAILLRDPMVARIAWLDLDLEALWAFGPAGPEPLGELQRWIDANDGGWTSALEIRGVSIGAVLGDPQQRPVIPINVPIRLSSGIGGVMMVGYDAGALLESVLPPGGGSVVNAIDSHGRTVLEGGVAEAGVPTVEATLTREPLRLVVSLAPSRATWAQMRSSTPGIMLIGGLAFAALTGLAMRLGQVQGLRARQASMLSALRREVDAREQAERQLAQRASALERSNADLARFAHMISHDLRAPLNVMEMHLQLLAEQETAAGATRHVTAARRASQRMVEMIDGLLEYARADTAGEHETVDAEAAAGDAVGNLERSIRDSGARVKIGELPRVRGQHQRLVQLFQNLVGNALRHRGEATPEVTVTCEPEEDHWLFRVADNGPGIEPADADRVFDLFESGGESPGSGLGLAICRRIVEAKGGRIWFESHPGRGTTMLFTWPRDDQSSDVSAPPSSER
jgi:signal transduction histidine kinase